MRLAQATDLAKAYVGWGRGIELRERRGPVQARLCGTAGAVVEGPAPDQLSPRSTSRDRPWLRCDGVRTAQPRAARVSVLSVNTAKAVRCKARLRCCITPRFNCRRSTRRRAIVRLLLILKASNCDDFLEPRACQLQALVMRRLCSRRVRDALATGLNVSFPSRE